MDHETTPRFMAQDLVALCLDQRFELAPDKTKASDPSGLSIEDPVVLNAELGVALEPDSAILFAARRRQDLDHEQRWSFDSALRDVFRTRHDHDVGLEDVVWREDQIDRSDEDLTSPAQVIETMSCRDSRARTRWCSVPGAGVTYSSPPMIS